MSIITLVEFKANREVANTLQEKKFNPLAEDVELTQIQSRLGLEFYQDIIANPTATANAALLTGGSYTYQAKSYNSPGLKAVIIDFTYAIYKSLGDYTDTGFGTVVKTTQFGDRADRNERKDLRGHYEKIAESKWQLVELFLNRNSAAYPLWGYNEIGNCTPSRGVNFGFSKIG